MEDGEAGTRGCKGEGVPVSVHLLRVSMVKFKACGVFLFCFFYWTCSDLWYLSHIIYFSSKILDFATELSSFEQQGQIGAFRAEWSPVDAVLSKQKPVDQSWKIRQVGKGKNQLQCLKYYSKNWKPLHRRFSPTLTLYFKPTSCQMVYRHLLVKDKKYNFIKTYRLNTICFITQLSKKN